MKSHKSAVQHSNKLNKSRIKTQEWKNSPGRTRSVRSTWHWRVALGRDARSAPARTSPLRTDILQIEGSDRGGTQIQLRRHKYNPGDRCKYKRCEPDKSNILNCVLEKRPSRWLCIYYSTSKRSKILTWAQLTIAMYSCCHNIRRFVGIRQRCEVEKINQI